MFVSACSSRARSASTRSRDEPSQRTARPCEPAAEAKRAATESSTSPTSSRWRSSGSRPCSARAITSRSSASFDSRSTSSAAERTRAWSSPSEPSELERQLELELEDRQGRAQLVAGVGDERALARERVLEPAEHRVDGVAEAVQLVVGLGQRKPLAARRARDPRGLRAHLLHRRQRAGREHVAGYAGEDQEHRAADEQQVAERGQGAVALGERGADDEHRPRAGVDGPGQDAGAPADVEQQRALSRPPDLLQLEQRRGRARRDVAHAPRRGVDDLRERAAGLGQLREAARAR